MERSPVCCVFGKIIAAEESLQAMRNLQHHIVYELGAEPLDRWTVEVTYKLKHKKKKAMGNEMKFGINVAAPFVGMKREEGSEYPFAKQYCIRRSDRRTRVCVVQEMEMAEGASRELSPHLTPIRRVAFGEWAAFSMDSSRDGKIAHVLEGPEGMEATLAANTGLVARLKAIIDGQAYQLGDFIIRVGSCRKGAVYKGLCLEVEYKPCCIVLGGVAMIEALLPTIDDFGTFVRSSDLRDPAVFGTNPEFSVQHTALQTINLLSTVLI